MTPAETKPCARCGHLHETPEEREYGTVRLDRCAYCPCPAFVPASAGGRSK